MRSIRSFWIGLHNMEIIKIKLSVSNAYLVKDRKSILVDTGSSHEADKILAEVKRAGVNEKDISLILHTHGHVDHAGSTAELKRRLGVPVAVHAEDAFMLKTGTNGTVNPINFSAAIYKQLLVKPFEPSQPDLEIDKEMTLKEFGVNARVVFTPGHTKGSLSILLGNKEAIIGDVMMGGFMGGNLFPARPMVHYFFENFSEVRSSIKKVIEYKPSKLYVGHGGPLSLDAVISRFSNQI